MNKFFLLMCVLVASSGVLLGGTSSQHIVATRINTALRIDGLLDDEAWKGGVAVSGFQQFDPEEGASSTETTSVRILYDDNALYVGVMCYDGDPNGIIEQLTRRDRSVQADRFSVIIDSYHDHATAFLFSGSVSGVQSDGVLSQDGRVYDVQWDAVWDYDSKKLPDGWSAEFKIPFSALRFGEQDSDYVWGINFRRYIARKKETDEWVMVPRKDVIPGTVSSVSKMGHVSGISNIHPALHIEILPYQVSKVNSLHQNFPYSIRNEFKSTAGLDLKYGLTNNFTLDLAVNPDFGQVEVDQAVLNLTVFKTFYPEKRPFFLEGAQLFSFGNTFDNKQLQLFYSRQIGRKPDAIPDYGYEITEKPQVTTILSAAKLTGRTDNGLTIAALTALTNREEATEVETAEYAGYHRPKSIIAEPRASYNVLRLKQDIGDQSSIGMVATGSFKDERVPSLSGGVDWNLRLDEGEYMIDGYLAGSQPRPNHTGGAGKIAFARPQDEHFLAFTTYDFSTYNFFIDDLGFYSQPLEHGGYTELIYKEDRAPDPIRRYSLIVQSNYRWNWQGANTLQQIELQPSLELRNFWTFSLDFIHDFPAYDDNNRGINGLYLRPSGEQVIATVQTDLRKPVVLSLRGGYFSSTKGMGTLYSNMQMTLRPNSWMEFTPGFTIIRTRNEEAWVISQFTLDGFNLFGDRDVDQFDFSLRGTITFTRRVSVQFFTQIFLAKGQYSNYKKLISPEDLPPDESLNNGLYPIGRFNQKIFNANLVFRWEYLPGSTFYLVWTQERFGDDGMYSKSLSDNFSETFKLPADNVFLAKISYWWSL